MIEINQNSERKFQVSWSYVWGEALRSFKSFVSPVQNIRDVREIAGAGKIAAEEYKSEMAEAYSRLTWSLVFQAFLNWLKKLIRG